MPSALPFITIASTLPLLASAAPFHAQDGKAATATLERLIETRVEQLSKPDEDGMMFTSWNQPGLVLTFRMNLPEGVNLLEMAQPANVTAKDSAGKDLADIEVDGFSDVREYIELSTTFSDEPATKFDFTLLPASRKAETFSLTATVEAQVYTGTKAVELDMTETYVAIPDLMIDGKPVQARLEDQDGSGGLQVRPATAQPMIEKVEVMADGEVMETSGWFADGRTITYSLGTEHAPKAKVRITLRTGVKTMPVTIELKDQALP